MPRHDYELPAEWPGMTEEERDQWFHEERSRRQAMNQDTTFRLRIEDEIRRIERKRRFKKTKFLGRRKEN